MAARKAIFYKHNFWRNLFVEDSKPLSFSQAEMKGKAKQESLYTFDSCIRRIHAISAALS